MRLRELYNKNIISEYKKKMGVKNSHAVPMLKKVIIGVGAGEAKENPKIIDMIAKDLMIITGQKPVVTTAKKAISGFKIRQGEKIGLKTTLRGKKMYDFLERLVRISLPRIRDFRGLKTKGFDKNGNYNLGIKEHIVFPEIKFDKVQKNFGLQVTIVSSAKNANEGYELLSRLGFPFEKEKK